MATSSIKILGWSSRGMRCPDYSVDFSRNDNGDVHRVSLIQMPNGTGKTTTLNLLRAALSGKSPDGRDWTDYPVLELAGQDSIDGEFIVHLMLDEKKYSIRLSFDFKEPKVDIYTTGQNGEAYGFNAPRALDQFLNPNFVRFFVFDGELANDLKDPMKQNAEQAIDALFQFSSFKRMGEWASDFLTDRISQQSEAGGTRASTDKGLQRQKNLVDAIKIRLEELRTKQTELQNSHDDAKTRVIELENTSKIAIASKADMDKKMRSALAKEKSAELALQKTTSELLDALRDPYRVSVTFAIKLDGLRSSFDRVKLPENTAREWFEELAEEDSCICGRPIGPAEQEHIRTKSHQYLGSGDVALLNQLKSEISSNVIEPFKQGEDFVNQIVSEVRKSSDDSALAKAEVVSITDEAALTDPTVGKAEKEIVSLKDRMRRYEEELRRYRSRDHANRPQDCFNIQDLDRRLRTEQNNLDKITATADLRWKSIKLTEITGEIYQNAVKKMGAALALKVNETLELLMPDNKVRLKGIEKSLQLHERGGASVGETLAVGYAFLTHLTSRSDFALPLVIDTPAAPIDEHIRAQIGAILPKMVPQFIAFTISPERGSFTKSLSVAANGQIQYITMFRKSNARLLKSVDLDNQTVVETPNAILVHGIDYFDTFQDDSKYHRSE
jgi:DNA sulfur modification protein DndD